MFNIKIIGPASKIPPWSKQPLVAAAKQPEPSVQQLQQHQTPPPPPTVAVDNRTPEEKANEKSAMAVETWPPSLK